MAPLCWNNGADTAEIEPRASRRRNRNEGIDFVRGSLIILMILYHSVIFSRGDQLALFLREYFLTVTSGGFVFLAGVSVRMYAFRRFCEDKLKCSKNLVLRGLQLILIFCMAVVVGHFFAILPPPQGSIQEYLIRVFLVSYPQGVPYEVLLGIGYLLLISPIILCLLPHRTLSVVIVLLALSAATASGYRVGQNAWIVLCGLWGITLTHMGLERFAAGKISRILRLPWIFSLGLFVFAACIYIATGAPKQNIMIYVPYTASVLLMIYNVYMVGPPLWRRAGITKMVCDAGRMSLLWYLIHVPVVVVLNGSIHWGGGIVSFAPGFLMVVGITAALISIIGFVSRRAAAFQHM